MGIENAVLRKLPGLTFILLAVLSQLYIVKRIGGPRRAFRPLIWFYLALCLGLNFEVVKDPAYPVNHIIDWLSAGLTSFGWVADISAIALWLRLRFRTPFLPARRSFLNTAAAVVCVAPVAALTTGFIIRKDFQVKEINLKVPNLAKDLNGLRLLQLSDIHMSSFFSRDDMRRVVDASNNLNADLSFITGDLITGKNDPLDACLLELKRLKNTSGIWGCLGNHEQFSKVSNHATEEGRRQGINFLRHQVASLSFGRSRINLVGVDHQIKTRGYLKGVEDLVEPGDFNLLLSHNPDVFPVAAEQGFQLVLAGHTHGGQINIEVANTNLNIVDLVTPFTKGLYQQPGSSLYVTSGLGTIGVPVRLGAPPEITLIRLCAS